MTTVRYATFITIGAWPVAGLSLCSTDPFFVTYFISHSWDNKHSLTITSICLCALCSQSIATATADPPYVKQ